MVIYRNSLYVCTNDITILDLNTFSVTMIWELPKAEYVEQVQSVAIQSERMVLCLDENIICISLLLVGAKTSYIEAFWDYYEFTRLLAKETEEVFSFRDSRDNNFLMYWAEFANEEHFEIITFSKAKKKLKHFFEPNRHGESPVTIMLSVTNYIHFSW
jgi:hypothetical protein